MIYGIKYYNDQSRYHIQSNNPLEEALRKKGVKNYLESCGPTTAVNILDGMGYDITIKCPGVYQPQSEEVLTDCFNDPINAAEFAKIRPGVSSYLYNEIPQFYPYAVQMVFGQRCVFDYWAGVNELINHLKEGRGLQICQPGHFVAAVAYDDSTNEFIINDPWPEHCPGGKGFNIRVPVQNLNIASWYIVYY